MNRFIAVVMSMALVASLGVFGCSKKAESPAAKAADDAATSTEVSPEDAPAKEYVEKRMNEAAAAKTEEANAGETDAAEEVEEQAKENAEAVAEIEPADADHEHETKQLDTEEIAKVAEPAGTEVLMEEILLGTAELTKGIPGDGKLTIEQVTAWLKDPKNHAVITPTLPLGLAAGAGQIAGLVENPLTRAKIELGRQLYFDPRLSQDHSISCASCHHPDFGYAKDTQFGEGVRGQKGNRNSPVAYNRILSSVQFWDGRAATLEEQAKGPIANPIEMSNTHDVCVAHLAEIPGYKAQFEEIFPDGVNIENVAKAIASFERALVTGPSPWDYHEQLKSFSELYAGDLEDLEALKEGDPELYQEYMGLKEVADKNPMSESAVRGAELFFSDKAGCTQCHVGANFTDEQYHNIGVGMDAEQPDLGRYEITKEEKDKGAFKTPTVRNIELTGPFMHDGSQKTLEEVVEFYDKGGHPNQWLDVKIKKLNLTPEEKADLVAFMKALTGPLPEVEAGRLPE